MINVLYCGNDKVFDGMLTGALSALMRTETAEPFVFHVFTMDASHIKPEYRPVGEKQMRFFGEAIKKYNPGNSCVLHDVGEYYAREFGGCPNESAYCSPYTLLRLLADLVPDMPDKILYLDADVMFNRDIRLLYDTDVSEYEYAAARDHYGKYLLRPDYINAGVLLFNLQKMKQTGILAASRGLLREKKLLFADQSALFRSTTRKKLLPQRFNDQKFLHKHTVVRHFSKRLFWLPYPHTENIKQWQTERVRKVFGYKEFDDVLDEYLRLKERFTQEVNDG
ncbi:MAG: lipopolysaccharide biosynthesis protein [Clostridia bacterium]|jgi:lipopolysaccharide biosynthesis glycosyltransferase|nr:lipopolysaccharide biosynthesis protein [Clostridia bacterium]